MKLTEEQFKEQLMATIGDKWFIEIGYWNLSSESQITYYDNEQEAHEDYQDILCSLDYNQYVSVPIKLDSKQISEFFRS